LALDSGVDIYRQTKFALKMLLLTGQRPGEVVSMRWDEIKGNWWTIPEAKAKNREENRVPLVGMAVEILTKAKMLSGDTPFVFTSSYKPKQAMSVNAMARAVKRHMSEIDITEDFTPHDLRRTLRTRLSQLGVSDLVAEKVLGHKLQGILAVYNRYAYGDEKRQALELWEAELQKILELKPQEARVIPFSTKGNQNARL
jgi:integrase